MGHAELHAWIRVERRALVPAQGSCAGVFCLDARRIALIVSSIGSIRKGSVLLYARAPCGESSS